MKITFLGTGTSQGVPVIACHCEVCQSDDARDRRLRTSVHIVCQGISLVIDTGPDFRLQMLQNRVEALDAVLFTHTHKDHTAGLDDIRPFCFKQQKDMPLYATEASLRQIRQEFAYIFADEKYPGVPTVEEHLITTKPFYINEIEVTPIEVLHGNLSVLGFRIGKFTYITDAKTIAPAELQKMKGSEVVVLNALRHKEHHSHLNLSQAIELAKQIGAPRTYFTHISHDMGKHAEVASTLPKGMFLAYDGLSLQLTDN